MWKENNVWAFNTGMPVVVRIAYFAEALFPDLIDSGYGDKVNQMFVNEFFGASYTIEDGKFFEKIND